MHTKLTVDEAERVVVCLQNKGIEAYIDENYSGKSMYGNTTVGIITTASPLLIGYIFCLINIPFSKVPVRQDSMGYDTIYY